jgi:hypothetical protein
VAGGGRRMTGRKAMAVFPVTEAGEASDIAPCKVGNLPPSKGY